MGALPFFWVKQDLKYFAQYLSDYASNGMSLLQVYLNPFPDAFLDGIFGTPGSSKFVVIESVNWKRVLFFQNQFEKKGKADTGIFSPSCIYW